MEERGTGVRFESQRGTARGILETKGRPEDPPGLCLLFVRYDVCVGNARTCVDSFVDSGGIRHSVEVAAESLYEAAALAVKEFRRHPWSDGIEPGTLTPLEVHIKRCWPGKPWNRSSIYDIAQRVAVNLQSGSLLD